MMIQVLATIKLQDGSGCGDLFLKDGDIWCRRHSDKSEMPTNTSNVLDDENDAIDAINCAWGKNPDFKLEWE